MKITYNGKEYEMKYSFRAMMIFENITNKSFKPTGLNDIIIFFYSCLLGATKGKEIIKYDDFLDWLDENPNEVENFSNWLIETFTQNQALAPNNNNDTTSEENIEADPKN